MMKKTKLELTWIGKEERPRLEPRVLVEDSKKSYHAAERVSDNDLFDNRLIFGDNLLALRALEQEFAGKIKCIYIDPPYNTGDAMPHYEDGVEHSIWLSLMRERFEVLHRLLASDGVFFCQLNDDELAYAKVLLDEVFGRPNYLNQVSVQMKLAAGASGGGEDKRLKKNVEYILVYVKDNYSESGFQRFNDVFEEVDLFDLIDDMEASGKSWKYTSILTGLGEFIEERTVFDGGGDPITVKKYKGIQRTTINALLRADREGTSRESAYLDNFERIFSDTNAQTSIRTRIMDEFVELAADELLVASYIPKSGRDKGRIVEHYYISPTIRRVIWLKDSAEKRGDKLFKREKLGTYWSGFPLNNLTKEGGVQFPHGKKPEALVKTVIDLCTVEGDWVLDSFAGSGTTAATAHKLGRKWIAIELGEHCHSHIVPRLIKVINGADTGGITTSANWKGGGGFRYYSLAPSLLQKDDFGNWVINREYNAELLAQAVCKIEGFTYAPSDEHYWQHGHSTERDYIYVTTQTLTREQIEALADEVGPNRSLVIYCRAFKVRNTDQFPSLTLKKIPKAVLTKCEWGHDDYSLEIKNLPSASPAAKDDSDGPPPPKSRRNRKEAAGQPTLFSMEGGEQ